MIGDLALNQKLATLLAADATTLAPATDPNVIALVTNSFTPTPQTVIGDLTFASGDGLDPIIGTAGTQHVGVDPVTGESVISMVEPAGGWRWQLTGTPGSPVVVYGFALLTTASAAYLASELLPTPITLQVIGDFLDIGSATFRLPVGTLS
jgi:hypothetical protein